MYNTSNLVFTPSELTSSETFAKEFVRLKRQTQDIRERIELYNATFADENNLPAEKEGYFEDKIVQHLNSILLLVIAFYSFANRNFLVLTAARFAFMVKPIEASFIDGPLITVKSWYSFLSDLRQPNWELVLQIACLTFILVNVLTKNSFNRTALSDVLGRVVNNDHFNILFTFQSSASRKCYRLEETVTVLFPLRIPQNPKIVRIECVTPIRHFIISNSNVSFAKPLVFLCLNKEGMPVQSIEPVLVSFSLKSVQWLGPPPTQDMEKGGKCSVSVIANPFLDSAERNI